MCVEKKNGALRLIDDFKQRPQKFSPGVGVEAGDWLVEDQQVGLVAEGEDDAERLELADRERGRRGLRAAVASVGKGVSTSSGFQVG